MIEAFEVASPEPCHVVAGLVPGRSCLPKQKPGTRPGMTTSEPVETKRASAGASAGIAQILFFLFLAFLVISLVVGLMRRRT